MKVLDVQTLGVRALRDGAYRLHPGPGAESHVTLVTGPVSAGVTTLLEAVAFTAARLRPGGIVPDAEDVIRTGTSSAEIRTTWWLDPAERAAGGVREEMIPAEVRFRRGALGPADGDPALLSMMARYDHRHETAKVVLIPARRVTDSAIPLFADFEAEQRHTHLFGSPDRFAGLPAALARLGGGHGDKARFDDARRLFDEVSPGTRLLGVSGSGQLQFGLRRGGLLRLAQLGFAERNLFVLAAAVPVMGLGRSVILLDTPELGLGPGLAARCLDVLRGYAPEAQWIVASRDPDVLRGPGTVVDLARGGS